MADKKAAEQFIGPPPDLGKWEGFRLFIYNSETGQFMGRTGTSWAKIFLFYLIFYAVLVGFFAAILAVFYQTLDSKKPKWQLESSIIGNNPGLGFRPMPSSDNTDSSLIYYRANDKGSVHRWTKIIDEFLEGYRRKGYGAGEQPGAENRVVCTGTSQILQPNQVCDVFVDKFGPCTKDNQYNYEKGGPCVFLKLNKIFNWKPVLYNKTDSLPKEMPQELKDYIDKSPKKDLVWVSCEGENPADKENIGPIQYLPHRGFPAYYYPFTNVEGYLSPLVAVLFERPNKGVLINIECKAWAHNIVYDRYERRGSVHFELMVDMY